MKKKYLSFLLLSLLLISCNRIGLKYWPIPVEQLFGTYDLRNGKKLILNSDYTYVYFYDEDNTTKSDIGNWRYYYFESQRKNEIYSFNIDTRNEGKKGFRFYACKHWGKIIITNGYEGDPDGAPALKWYKKVK
jgi:hypothetical protein